MPHPSILMSTKTYPQLVQLILNTLFSPFWRAWRSKLFCFGWICTGSSRSHLLHDQKPRANWSLLWLWQPVCWNRCKYISSVVQIGSKERLRITGSSMLFHGLLWTKMSSEGLMWTSRILVLCKDWLILLIGLHVVFGLHVLLGGVHVLFGLHDWLVFMFYFALKTRKDHIKPWNTT